MIIGYTVPEIWHVTDVIVIFILGYFLPFYHLFVFPGKHQEMNEMLDSKDEKSQTGELRKLKCMFLKSREGAQLCN